MNNIEQKITDVKNFIEKLKILTGPLLGMIISGGLIALTLYIIFVDKIDLNNLADANGTIRIPIVFLIILIPVGFLIDFVGETAGVLIIIVILLLIFILSVRKLIKNIKLIKNSNA